MFQINKSPNPRKSNSKKIYNKIALSYLYVLSREREGRKKEKNNEDGIKIID